MKKNHSQENISKPLEAQESDHLVQLILAAAKHNPERIAICTSKQHYSYQSLIDYIENAIEDLVKNGIAKGDVIGIHGNCSFDFIGYFLACLSLGAVSVFIDENLPYSRKILMLKSAKAKCIINLSNELYQLHEREIEPKASTQDNNQNTLQEYVKKIHFNDPAYIFFTSGSTGTPKGVIGCHGGLNHFINWQKSEFGINTDDRVGQLTSLSFDVILREILLPLVSGASLWIPPKQIMQEKTTAINWIADRKITLVHTVPTIIRSWLSLSDDAEELTSLRYLFSAGEPLLASLVQAWREKFGIKSEIVNLYGPTETTLAKCHYRIPREICEGIQPLGKAMPGAEIWIMRNDQSLYPQGEIGEIVIRTPYRTLGYLSGIENSIAFQKNKHSVSDNDLLYFTGDLGKFDENGLLRIIGRKDNQVKIRGVRIEPGEIERKIYEFANVLHAVVLPQNLKADELSLVAYIQGRMPFSVKALANFMQEQLPATHIPAKIILVEDMPLTSSNKVNRPALKAGSFNEVKDFQTANTELSETEQKVHHIFCETLGQSEISADAHILHIGCESLQAMSILNRLHDTFGLKITFKELINNPTVREIGRYVEKSQIGNIKKQKQKVNKTSSRTADLSSTQKRLWLTSESEQDYPHLYNMTVAIKCNGTIDANKLRSCMAQLIQQNDILRVVIERERENDRVSQYVADWHEAMCDFEVIDTNQSETPQQLTELSQKPFDLYSGPLTRFRLYQTGKKESIVAISQHHIISDDYSMRLLLEQLASLYNQGLSTNKTSNVYFQFVDEEAKHTHNDSLDYWKQELHGYSNLDFPTDMPRKAIFDHEGNSFFYCFSTVSSEQIKQISKHHQCNPFALLLSAFYSLLARHTYQNDITVGIPVTIRPSSKFEYQPGCFVNTLALREQIAFDTEFSELLTNVQMHLTEALSHSDCPFDEIIQALNITRDPSRTPLYQVMFNMQTGAFSDHFSVEGLIAQDIPITTTTAKCDMVWTVITKGDHLALNVEYATSLFHAETIKLLCKRFETLLESILLNQKTSIKNLSLLPEGEAKQVIYEFNDTQKSYDVSQTLISLFLKQASKTPNAIALRFKNEIMTYHELLLKASQLASLLKEQGVQRNRIVGVCMQRSMDLIVSLYGILLAGGAYLPLDPDFPESRLRNILDQSSPQLVLTSNECLMQLPIKHGDALIFEKIDWGRLTPISMECAINQVHPEDLAYVIYTSGSTGNPKGVIVPHSAIVNRLQWMQDTYELSSNDVVLQKTPYTFDVSVWEFFWPLFTGAQLAVLEPDLHKDPSAIGKAIHTHQVTVLHFVPSMLQLFLEAPETRGLETLRLVFCSGEILPKKLVDKFKKILPTELHNLYGPTEAAVDVSYWSCNESHSCASTPIGYPISNIQLYVLDEALSPVPIGVKGELYIGGKGLALGYLNQPKLTEERFIINPLTPSISSKLYKTGDIAKWLTNGAIEFLGRADHQVKFNGLRIELGDIEAQILSHPLIQEAAVTVLTTKNRSQLVAYVVNKNNGHCTSNELKAWLQDKLPHYMQPTAFVFLGKMPLSPNGKINRKQLPAPCLSASSDNPANTVALSKSQVLVLKACENVLDIPASNFRLQQSFFEHGGSSLQAIQVVSRLRETLAKSISVKDFLIAPTLFDFCQKLSKNTVSYKNDISVSSQGLSRAPLSYTQKRIWFLEKHLLQNNTYQMATLFEIEGVIDLKILKESIGFVVSRHDMLRASIQEEGEAAFQVIEAKIDIDQAVIFHDLTRLDIESDIEKQMANNVDRIISERFCLNHAPLWQIHVFKLAANKWRLLLKMHHIISDGWSVDNIVKEINLTYKCHHTNQPIKLPAVRCQYTDYASHQHKQDGKSWSKEKSFWQEYLNKDSIQQVALPYDYPRKSQSSFKGESVYQSFSNRLQSDVTKFAKSRHVSVYSTLLAAFNALLYRYSAQSTILVGTTVANRNDNAIENTIGFFANTLVHQTEFTNKTCFNSLVEQVYQDSLNIFLHQDIPYELLLDSLGVERDLASSPLFQVMFVLQNTEETTLTIDGKSSRKLEVNQHTAKFDLTLFVKQRDDGWLLELEYSTDLFSNDTATRLVMHYFTLLEDALGKPEEALSQLKLLTSNECDWLQAPNQTDRETDYKRTLVSKLTEVALARPNKLAVSSYRGDLTYSQLNSVSNKIAHQLIELGARKNKLIAVVMEKGWEQVAAVSGVLKAGAAYLPISAHDPDTRIKELLDSGEVEIVLTQNTFHTHLKSITGRVTLDISAFGNDNNYPTTDPKIEVDPESIAYVIFTSGSTGKPKGVVVTHQSAMNTIVDINQRFNITANDNIFGISALHFDLSVYDIFGAMEVGASLILPAEHSVKDPSSWYPLLESHTITIWNTVPQLMQMLTEYLLSNAISPSHQLKTVLLSGDWLPIELPEQIWHLYGKSVSVNSLGGATEASIWSILYPIKTVDKAWASIPYGKPLTNQKFYVLNEALQAAPINVIGELYIGGVGLAQGYWKDKTRTKTSFILHPDTEERLYRTGDLGKYLPDGNIAFAGRVDQQVKIRGFRVELGEVTAALKAIDGIEDAITIAKTTDSQKVLASYYTCPDNVSVSHVKTTLKDRLPTYMVPQILIEIDNIPLTANGKVDMKALSGITTQYRQNDQAISELLEDERAIAEIWQEVLPSAEIRRSDNYFQLGGNSLGVIRILNTIKGHYDITVSIQEFFKQDTFSEFCQLINSKLEDEFSCSEEF